MPDHNSCPHVYTQCKENKTTTSKLHQYNLINGLLYAPHRNSGLYPKLCWDAETGDATHGPRGFPENIEGGIQLPTF